MFRTSIVIRNALRASKPAVKLEKAKVAKKVKFTEIDDDMFTASDAGDAQTSEQHELKIYIPALVKEVVLLSVSIPFF